MIMQYKNKLVCFIITTEQRNTKMYYRVCCMCCQQRRCRSGVPTFFWLASYFQNVTAINAAHSLHTGSWWFSSQSF